MHTHKQLLFLDAPGPHLCSDFNMLRLSTPSKHSQNNRTLLSHRLHKVFLLSVSLENVSICKQIDLQLNAPRILQSAFQMK